MKAQIIFYQAIVALVTTGQAVMAQPSAPTIMDIQMVPRLTIQSELGATNVIEYANELAPNQWLVLTNLVVTTNFYVVVDLDAPPSPKRFYRVVIPEVANVTTGMVLIPAGSFTMGDTFNEGTSAFAELPTHTVFMSAFYMDRSEVTKALWDEVKTWASANGYSFDNAGLGKAANHPVHTVCWYDAVKWCNARSEKEGLVPAYYTDEAQSQVYREGQVNIQNDWVKWNAGYRLPTEAEWEYAARGGVSGHRFPWSNVDTITHNQANYKSSTSDSYDISSTRDYHPDYDNDPLPYTSPVGSFAANGYGLYDMAGNILEWCWDWCDDSYVMASQIDPRGPSSGMVRVARGGGCGFNANECRVASRLYWYPYPDACWISNGFRSILPAGQ